MTARIDEEKQSANPNGEEEIRRHPQPIEPSIPESVRPQKDPQAAPFVPPRQQHTKKDVSAGTRKPPPARPQQPSIDSLSRAEGEGMTPPASRPSAPHPKP